MVLPNGLYDVPPGMVASIVTTLEMRASAPLRGRSAPEGVTLRHIPAPGIDWYRRLFRHVGGDWLWFSRLDINDAALSAILENPEVQVFAVERNGAANGLLELDFRQPGACELAYFGLGPSLIGQGVGGWLMDQAITRAWSRPITRFHVHTCTLDHPGALGFYIRSGFAPIRRQVEIAADPRLSGALPADCAPQIPQL